MLDFYKYFKSASKLSVFGIEHEGEYINLFFVRIY